MMNDLSLPFKGFLEISGPPNPVHSGMHHTEVQSHVRRAVRDSWAFKEPRHGQRGTWMKLKEKS